MHRRHHFGAGIVHHPAEAQGIQSRYLFIASAEEIITDNKEVFRPIEYFLFRSVFLFRIWQHKAYARYRL